MLHPKYTIYLLGRRIVLQLITIIELIQRKNQDFIVTFGEILASTRYGLYFERCYSTRKYPNIKFNLLGDGRDAKRAAQLIKDNKLQQNVGVGRHP